MKNIAIIPARSGSKGLVNKNIKIMNGKPLLAYSIEAAMNSNLFDEIHVSTDSQEYANIALRYGAKVPFIREKEYAEDLTSSWDVAKFVLDEYNKMNKKFDRVTLLQPTSPLRTGEDIKKAFEVMETKKAYAVVGVCEMEHTPLWCNILPKDNCMDGFFENLEFEKNRQQLSTYYRINGAIYVVDIGQGLDVGRLYQKDTFAYVMDMNKSIDIDGEVDFIVAETIMRGNEDA